jgi:hypothetical protein
MTPESREMYEKALADMKADRGKLDDAISAMERLLGIEGAPPSDSAPNSSISRPDTTLRADTFFGMGIVPAAKKYLRMKREPLTTAQLRAGLEAGGLKHTSKDFTNTLGAVLYRDAEKTGELVRVKNTWGLKEWYPGLRKSSQGKSKQDESENEGADLNPLPK